jgi:hypothetical protein
MPRRDVLIAVVMFVGLGSVAGLMLLEGPSRMTAGFWLEAVPADTNGLIPPLPLTGGELTTIARVARRELDVAFRHSRLQLSDVRTAAYRVRVVSTFDTTQRVPTAGGSRSFGGRSGHGAVNLITVAISAVSFSPPDTPREELVQAIGRGVGRTAAHEFAHQILGDVSFHETADRFSYEFADLRAEHFHAQLHWGPAAPLLQQRIGLRP